MTTTARKSTTEELHEDIANHLRESIYDDTYSPGDPLPSEAELCRQFNSSRGPVRQAMAALRAEGLISSGRGRRSVVLNNVRTQSFEASLSVTACLASHGYEAGQQTSWVARIPASEEIAAGLGVEPGEKIISLHRLRLANGEPLLIEQMHFRAEPGQHVLAFDTDSGSIHRHLAEQGISFNSVSRKLRAVLATEEDAKLLGVEPGAPLQETWLRITDPFGTPLEYSRYLHNDDVLHLGVNVVRGDASPVWADLSI